MKKNLILVATLAMAMGTATTMFTSCSDNDDIEAQTAGLENNISTSKSTHDGTYTYTGEDGNVEISVKISGNSATVSCGSVASGESNAELVYEDGVRGHINMKDNSLGVSQIPFGIAGGILHLNLNGVSNISEKDMYIEKDEVSSRSNSILDPLEDAIRAGGRVVGLEDSQTNTFMNDWKKAIGQYIVNGQLIKNFGQQYAVFGQVAAPVLNWLFPDPNASAQDPGKAVYDNIQKQYSKINAHIDAMTELVDNETLTKIYREHERDINELRKANEFCKSAISDCGYDIKTVTDPEFFKEYAHSYIGGKEEVFFYITSILSKYGQGAWFDDLDKFYIHANPYYQDSFTDRDYFRVHDFEVLHDAVYLLKRFAETDNTKLYKADQMANIESGFNNYCATWAEYCVYPEFEDSVIFNINGARLAVSKTIESKHFGDGFTFDSDDNGTRIQVDSHDFSWLEDYIWGKDGNNIKDKVLTREEAEVLSNIDPSVSLDKMLVDKFGMTKSSKSNSFMLVGNYRNYNYDPNGWNTVPIVQCFVDKDEHVDIATSGIDYSTGKYSESNRQKLTINKNWRLRGYDNDVSADYVSVGKRFDSSAELLTYVTDHSRYALARYKKACYETVKLIKEKYGESAARNAYGPVSMVKTRVRTTLLDAYKETLSWLHDNWPEETTKAAGSCGISDIK